MDTVIASFVAKIKGSVWWCKRFHRDTEAMETTDQRLYYYLESIKETKGGLDYQRVTYREITTVVNCKDCYRELSRSVKPLLLKREYLTVPTRVILLACAKSADTRIPIVEMLKNSTICPKHGYPIIRFGEYFPNSPEGCYCQACEEINNAKDIR